MKSPTIKIDSCLAAAVALFGATLLWRLLTFSGFSNDHYAHLALAQQMLLGDWPVRDFLDPGWPLTYLLSAAAWRVAGDAMAVEWTITATALALGAALTVIAAHRLSGFMAIAVLVTAFEVLIYPRTYAYPKILAYAVFAWLVTQAALLSTRRLIALGLLVAGAFLLRHDHGVWIGAATIVYVALASHGDGPAAAVRRVAIVAAAAVAAVLPWFIYIAASSEILAYLATAVEYARAEANATMLDAWPWFGQDTNAEAWLFWLIWSLAIASAVTFARRWIVGRERWPGELAAAGALVVLAACVNVGFLRDPLRTRLADAMVPAALHGAWLLGIVWTEPWRRPAAQRLAKLAAVLVVVVSVPAILQLPDVRDRVERTNLASGARGVAERFTDNARLLRLSHRQAEVPPSRIAAALIPFFEYLDRCSAQADRLIVTGDNPDIVVLAGRRFASDGIVFGAWYSSVARHAQTLERLRHRPALFVVLLDEVGFRERFPGIAAYVDGEYRPFATIEAPGVRVPILVHAGRAAPRVDGDTGWPCFR